MRKRIALGTLVAAVAAAGIAEAVTNQYSVTASTKPTKAGSAKNPVRVALKFAYKVTEKDGLRPSGAKRYALRFGGIRLSQKGLRTCTAAQINAAGTDRNCPAGAIVGSGYVRNILGPTSDPSNKSLTCFLDLTLYNSTRRHATLFLEGNASQDVPADKRCITNLAVAIDARYVIRTGSRGYTSLNFSVPQTLRHPLPGFDNALVETSATINNVRTKEKVGGRTLGYYSSVGGCRSGKRPVQVTFTSEDNNTTVKKTSARCTR